MILQNPFAAICSSNADATVLEVMTRSDSSYTLSEIFVLQHGSASRTTLRASVNRYVEHGVVIERQFGKTYSYELNRNHVAYEAIQLIASSRTRIFQKISDEVASWPVEPLTVQLFGSAVRGEMSTDSDIDFLVVSPDDWSEAEQFVGQLAEKISSWTGNDARPLFYYEREIADAPVLRSVAKEGIEIVGESRWLSRKLSNLRKAQQRGETSHRQ